MSSPEPDEPLRKKRRTRGKGLGTKNEEEEDKDYDPFAPLEAVAAALETAAAAVDTAAAEETAAREKTPPFEEEAGRVEISLARAALWVARGKQRRNIEQFFLGYTVCKEVSL